MKRLLLAIGIFIALFFSCLTAQAQNQTVTDGNPTAAITMPGTGCTYNWVNDTPGIGLPASGTGDIASFTAVNKGSSAVMATITATPVPVAFAYITDDQNNVSVINTATRSVIANIPVGLSPWGVAVSPDGTRAYVVNTDEDAEGTYLGNGGLYVINTATNTVITTIPVGETPYGVVVSPDGNRVYVTNTNAEGTPSIDIIGTTSNTIVATNSDVPNPMGIAISPDGNWIYVTSAFDITHLYVISTATNMLVSKIAVGQYSIGVAVSSDGGRVYLANRNSNTVSVVNAATNTLAATIAVGNGPFGVCLTPDGKTAYVTNSFSENVSVINTLTNTLVSTILVNGSPYGVSVSSDGKQVYAACQEPDGVSVINTATNTVDATLGPVVSPIAFGNFITPNQSCNGAPVTFTITVNPSSTTPPTIIASVATGTISACVGTASASPQIQQFTVSGGNLTGNITATAPNGFEVSLAAGSGYGNNVTIPQTAGAAGNTMVYVRSTASDPAGPVSGNVSLTSAGATTQTVAVTGTVNALPIVNTVTTQFVNNGAPTTAINFTGTGNTFNWTNDTPGIGLAASGTGNIASFTAVNTGSSAVKATIKVTAISSDLAFIVNFSGNSVSLINTTSNTIISTIPVGMAPFGASVSPDGSRVYVTNTIDGSVSVISVASKTVISTIGVGTYPTGIATSPDGSRVYVTNVDDQTVSVINTITNAVIATIPVGGGPEGVCVSPDGATVYVTNEGLGTISIISAVTNSVISSIALVSKSVQGGAPDGIIESPDGTILYVSKNNDNSISVISTSTHNVVATIPVGFAPNGIALTHDGSKLFVANFDSNTVSVINTANDMVIATINVGLNPQGISVNADGSLVYVTNHDSGSVSVIDTRTNTVAATVDINGIPIAFGNFIVSGTGCSGPPTTFTITVNPAPALPPAISVNPVTGSISACAGTASASPQLQQFTVSGSNLTADITITAPANFEISLSATGAYSSSLTLTQSGGTVSNTIIYVRSAASAPVGIISNNITIASTGASTLNPTVTATINALPIINLVSNQAFANGTTTTGVTFTGTATNINWVNDTPGIGLAASGNGNIAPFTAVNTGGSPIVAKIVATPVPVGYAYVVNANSNNVSVVNTATNKVIATIGVGNDPQAVTVSPDGSRVYVANNNDNTISVINTVTNSVTSTFSVGVAPAGYPYGLAVSPDGSKLYVANQQSNEVAIVNTATNAVVSTVAVGVHPGGIAVTPDGSTVYVANNGDNTVSVISAATNVVVSTVPVGDIPNEIAISPDGSKVYVTTATSIAVIDTKTNSIIATIQDPGGYLLGIAISPDGSWLYAVDSTLENVLVINTSTNAIASTIPIGYEPYGLSVTPDGAQLFVTRGNSNNVDVINTAAGAVTATIAVGSNPISLGNFILPGIGCSGAPVSFTITVNPSSATNAVITATGAPSPLNTIYGTPSTATVFTVSGTNMTTGILITPPAGFEVSINDINFGGTITVGSSGNIAVTTVYIRLASSTPVGHYSGNIVLSSAGAADVNVAMPLSTVTPADLTITADNESKIVGETNPVLTVTYSGFVNNDGPAQLIIQPVITTTALTTSPVGQYPITVSGATSPNYNITFVQGALTINPVPLMVVIPNTFTPNGDGINDTWDIKNLEMYPNCTVQIFNRYGENIYTSNGYGTPWNGTYKGAVLPTSTYYYIINLKNGSRALSGFVAIIR